MPSRRAFVAELAAATVALRAAERQLTNMWTMKEAAEAVRKKTVSPVELTRACLAKIDKLNPDLNAFITVMHDEALAQAKELEAEAMRGLFRSPIHGVPIALKDNMDTAGIRTTAASGVFADRVPTEDAPVVTKLRKAGSIFLGKTNMHEFAIGGTSAVSFFGPVKNPWNPLYHPGGSSGGSGVAVATGMAFGALGTDTGGSVRGPAAYCSISGLKPTYGRVSIRGVVPMCWTLDHVGPMAHTAEDCALLLKEMAGYDPEDTTSVDVAVTDYAAAIGKKVSELRVGIPRAVFYDKLHPDHVQTLHASTDVLRKLVASVKEVTLPQMANIPSIVNAEIWGYHAEQFERTPQSYQPSLRKTLERAKSAEVAKYLEAKRHLDYLRRTIGHVFEHVDILITPVHDKPTETIDEVLKRADADAPSPVILSPRSPFNVLGLPTMAVPAGFSANGLPIGMQLTANHWAEDKVFALAHAFQQATDWHTKHPPLPA